MPDRRGRKDPIEYPIEHDAAWAQGIWQDRVEIIQMSGGVGMLRIAANLLGLDDDHFEDELRRIRPQEMRGDVDQ